jgi:RNA polymerase-binding transcription factor DksA
MSADKIYECLFRYARLHSPGRFSEIPNLATQATHNLSEGAWPNALLQLLANLQQEVEEQRQQDQEILRQRTLQEARERQHVADSEVRQQQQADLVALVNRNQQLHDPVPTPVPIINKYFGWCDMTGMEENLPSTSVREPYISASDTTPKEDIIAHLRQRWATDPEEQQLHSDMEDVLDGIPSLDNLWNVPIRDLHDGYRCPSWNGRLHYLQAAIRGFKLAKDSLIEHYHKACDELAILKRLSLH